MNIFEGRLQGGMPSDMFLSDDGGNWFTQLVWVWGWSAASQDGYLKAADEAAGKSGNGAKARLHFASIALCRIAIRYALHGGMPCDGCNHHGM